MSWLYLQMHWHPVSFAACAMVVVLGPVWVLTSDYSPLVEWLK